MGKKILAVIGMFLSLAALPAVSNAACAITGVVVRVTSYDDAYTTTGGYVYFRTSSLSPSYYYATSNDDDTISNAIAHMNSGRTITIGGDVAACPAVPAAGGAASIGTVSYMYNP
ncbi:hypothetical protein BH11PSE9_BH11PSE9_00160 [soil metagenome]